MVLKSALEDLQQNTLATVSGSLAKLAYLASLRRENRYQHWGMENVHGVDATERAFRIAHVEIVAAILKTPLSFLEADLEISRSASALSAAAYIKSMRDHFDDLLPVGRNDAPSAAHLSSVLAALSCLKQHPGRATR
jgi:hypothetical protein